MNKEARNNQISVCLTHIAYRQMRKETLMLHSNGFAPLHDEKPPDAPKQVLVIEDNLPSLKMLGAIIAAQGYEVLEATTGLLGLELARRHRPALVVTDIRLPDISGLEVTQMLTAAGMPAIR